MTFKFLATTALALLTTSTAVLADTYIIDSKGQHATIAFRIKHLGFSWLTGRFDKFDGTFNFDEKDPGKSSVKVEIDTNSVNSNHGERDKHLRSADFLDVAAFPKAMFVSTSIKATADGKAEITGKLTLHGVTKEIAIAAERVGGGADPWGGFRQGFTGKTVLQLSDFGIKKDLGPASKSVELTLDVEGVKQ